MRNKSIHPWNRAAVLACAMTAVAASAAETSAEKTSVGGKAFIDFTHIDQQSNGVDVAPSGTGIDVKRFYLGVDHQFDDIWSANVTSDFNYVSADSETQIYIKKAYLQAKFDDAFVLRAGSADLPWVPFVEGLYGYRYVENVLIDHAKFGTSADWGLHAGGKFAGGVVSYAASAINGAGYKNPSRSKSVDFEGRISVEPLKGLTFAVGFYDGKLGQDKEAANATAAVVATPNSAQRLDVLVAYVNGPIRTGVEYFQAKNFSAALVTSTTLTDKADGYSGWFSFSFTDQFAAFGRYDHVTPSKDLNNALENKYFNVGVAYKPRKNIDLALVYKLDKVENGTMSVSNGSIGGSTDGKFSEIGVWAQVSF